MVGKNLKRSILATVLLMVFCITLFSIGTYAADNESYVVKINNTELVFTTLLYVDGSTGNDSTGDGTESNPYKTLKKAVEVCPQTGTGIILKGEDKSGIVITHGKKLSIIGDYLNYKSSTTSLFYSERINEYSPHDDDVKFYGIFFNNLETGDWYETFAVFKKIELYNCVFLESSGYSNVKVNENTFYNCYVVKTGNNNNSITMVNTLQAKDGVKVDSNYNVTSSTVWKNAGTGLNPDGSPAHLGVYGGPFAWNPNGSYFTTGTAVNVDPTVLTVISEKEKIRVKDSVSVDLVIQNIKEIAAEDIRIKYDSTKLQFISCNEVDGIKLVKNSEANGELRVILASKGINNIINDKKVLLKLNFKAIGTGEALVDITKGRVSDGIEMEKDLEDIACGDTTILIEEQLFQDVNKNDMWTLLDLAIDARHLGENVDSLPQYNTDIDINLAIDENDLIKIGEYMINDPAYTF